MLNLGNSIIVTMILIATSLVALIANTFTNSTEGWVVGGILLIFAMMMTFYSHRLFKRVEKSWEE